MRQVAIQHLIALGDEQIQNGFPDAGLLQLDRALRLTAKSKSPEMAQITLSTLMPQPLWTAAVSPQRSDRTRRLEQLTQLANQYQLLNPIIKAQALIKIAQAHQAANAMPMALKTIEPVHELTKNLDPLDSNGLALQLDIAELYAVLQPDRSRKILNQVIERLEPLESKTSPDDRHFVLNPRYDSIVRIYGLLGQPDLAESFAKRVTLSSNVPANELSAFEMQTRLKPQVSLAIAYANAKQQAKANQILTKILNSTEDASVLIDVLLQYAKAGQWTAATQATGLLKNPQTKFRARLDLGVLADQQGKPDRAIELGKLAAKHAGEAGSFSVGRDDVIQWLGLWLSSEFSTNALLPVFENLELYVYDDLVDSLLRGAVKQKQESVLKQALVWADQKAQPNSPHEAIMIYADRNQPDAAIRSALRAKNPYGQLAALASYYQRMQQPSNIAKVKQAASSRLAVETFGDVKQITEVGIAMSAIEAASGKLPAARISVRQALQNAKKKLSKDAYFVLTRELANQLLFYGQPELMTLVIAEIPRERQAVVQELLQMGQTFSGQFSLRHSSIDSVLRGLVSSMNLEPETSIETLTNMADLQIRKNQLNEAKQTLRVAIDLISKLTPEARNSRSPMLVHSIMKVNQPDLFPPVIASISNSDIRQMMQLLAGCSL